MRLKREGSDRTVPTTSAWRHYLAQQCGGFNVTDSFTSQLGGIRVRTLKGQHSKVDDAWGKFEIAKPARTRRETEGTH